MPADGCDKQLHQLIEACNILLLLRASIQLPGISEPRYLIPPAISGRRLGLMIGSRQSILIFVALCGFGALAGGIPVPATRFQVDDWQLDDGLPQNTVTAIVQSRDGYLWLGTYGGLARFDGVRFSIFESDKTNGLKSSRILRLFEDRSGILWIGTEGGGLSSYRDGAFAMVLPEQLGNQSVSALAEDEQGALWMGTVSGQVMRLAHGSLTTFSTTNGLPGQGIIALAQEPGGRLWVAAPEYLGCYTNGAFSAVAGEVGEDVQLAPGRGQGVWVINQGRLFKQLDGKVVLDCGAIPLRREAAPKRALYEDHHGNVWIATHGDGIVRYHGGAFDRVGSDVGLSHDIVLSVCEDGEGNLWAGTSGGGLNRLKERVFSTYDSHNGLSTDLALSVTEGHDGKIWIGTDGGGLNCLNDERLRVYSRADGLHADSITAVWESSRSNLWVGSSAAGVYVLQGERFTYFGRRQGLSSQSIRAIYEDRQGRIWIGTYDGGLNLFRNGKFIHFSTRDGLPHNDVRAIIEDRRGRLWIGTGGGLCCRDDERFKSFYRANGLPSDFIRVFHEDGEGALWIGTAAGLSRLKDGRFTNFTAQDGLPNDVISQIFEDEQGNFWIGSNRGIFRVRRQELEYFAQGRASAVNCVTYNRTDGLGSRECSGGVQPAGWKARDGRLWFPTIKGLAVVDPNNFKINPRPPDVIIEELRVNGQPVDLGVPVRMGPRADRFEIQYTGLSFSAPRRVKFKYKLEGFDPDWVDAGLRRVAYYNSVPPGKYQFHVIAANNDGVWNTAGAQFSLVMVPPFWRTGWFIFVAFGAMATSLVIVVRYLSIRKLRTALAAMEQQQALERERARIAKDMHDNIGASLTRIGLLGELVRRNAEQPAEVARQAARITDSSREVADTLDEIVWTVNPGNDSLERLIAYIGQYAEELFSLTSLRCRFDLPANPPNEPLSAELRHSLFLATKEALNNIVKHANATEVHLRIAFERPVVEISVEDNGRGFLATGAISGNGLHNMRRRLEDVGGKFECASALNQGTRILMKATIHL